MRYNINARLIYDATDGTLTLPGSTEPDSQLSITASALLYYFLRHTDVISRDEVLKKVWDDNGLTSSNSNLNQYLSMLRKTFRHYDIENIIVTVSRGMLQLNPELTIAIIDDIAEAPLSPQRSRADAGVRGPLHPRRGRSRPPGMREAPAGIWPAPVCWPSRCCCWRLLSSAAANPVPSP
jgi:DNA-binding winged helix-turn-helix (wHTH) protein